MKKLIIIVVLFSLINCVNKNTQITTEKLNDTLIYNYKGFNNGMKLYLLGNKFKYEQFSYGCTGGGESSNITGKFKISKNKLHLEPDSVKIKVLEFDSHSKFKTYNLKYKNDSLKIKTEYDIINWNNIQYLISSQKNENFRTHQQILTIDYDIDSVLYKRNDYHELADFVNWGDEPKEHGRYLTQIKKDVDTTKKFEINKIPKKWRNLFLEYPVIAKITKFGTEKRSYEYFENDIEEYYVNIVTLNKGSEDKVRVGMMFFNKSNEKFIKIISVSKNNSNGITSDTLKKGELVKTNFN